MKELLSNPIALGAACILLLVLLLLTVNRLLLVKGEFSRYRKMLSDKMELDAGTVTKQKAELESLRKENENLRVKVQTLSGNPDQKLGRELEIMARAEKKMTVAAPGFAAPWEQAKQAAHQELCDEEAGKSAPRRLFQRFFGGAISSGGGEPVRPLPPSSDSSKSAAPTPG